MSASKHLILSISSIFRRILHSFFHDLSFKKLLPILIGTAIASFGLYNIHQRTGITEGGILGTILLIHHWFGLSPSIVTPVLDFCCYGLAFRYLGKDFLKMAVLSTLSFSGFFRLWELFPPVLPDLSRHPLMAAVAGAFFIGIGVGLVIRQGGSSSGDDALALTISHLTHCRISMAYLATDLTVLLLSLSYIPWRKIAYSLVTVTISSWLIDWVQNFRVSPSSGQRQQQH